MFILRYMSSLSSRQYENKGWSKKSGLHLYTDNNQHLKSLTLSKFAQRETNSSNLFFSPIKLEARKKISKDIWGETRSNKQKKENYIHSSATSWSGLYFTCQTPFELIHYHSASKPFVCISVSLEGKVDCQDKTLGIYNDFISGSSLWLIGVLCHLVWQSRSLSDSVVTGDEHHVDESGVWSHIDVHLLHTHTHTQARDSVTKIPISQLLLTFQWSHVACAVTNQDETGQCMWPCLMLLSDCFDLALRSGCHYFVVFV